MPIELLATELGAKGDFKHFRFTGLGSVYIDYTHTFSTDILEEALPEEALKKRRTRKENIDQKKALAELLLEHFEKGQITEREEPFRVLQIRAKISEMLDFIQEQRDKTLLKKSEKELEGSQLQDLLELWGKHKSKIDAVKKMRRNAKDEGLAKKLDAVIQDHKDGKGKASYTLANKIVTGHYTEMIRWENSHPWSYYEIKNEKIPELLERRKQIEEELSAIRADAERALEKDAKRTITEMNKFFERHYGTEEFAKVNSRAFAQKLGPDLIARRAEAQKRINALKAQAEGIGRIERSNDEIKVILDSDRHFEFKRYIGSEEILNSRWCFIDIEKPRFDTPKEEVSWVAITYFERGILKKEIHTSKKVGDEFKKSFIEERGFEVIDYYENETSLMAGVEASINAMNPAVLCSYNTPYDLVELEKTEHGLKYGKRRARAKKEVTTKWFERINVPDKIIIDPLPVFKIAKKFLPNKKLAMITQELGLPFKKSIDYRVMAELENIIDGKPVKEAAKKTQEKLLEYAGTLDNIPSLKEVCAQIIARYVGDDVEILPQMIWHPKFQKYLGHIDWISKFAHVNFQKAAHTANSINNLQKKDFFEKTGTHLDTIHKRTNAQQRAENRIRNFVKRTKKKGIRFEETKEEKKSREEKERGLRKGIAHFTIPSWPFLREDAACRFPGAKQFFEYADMHKAERDEFYFLSQYADALCRHLLHAWGTYIKARDEFEARIKNAGLNFYKIDEACRTLKHLLEETHDKNQLRRAYVNLKTIETCLDSGAYIQEHWKEEDEQDREDTKRAIKDSVKDSIRKIRNILKDSEMEADDFQQWLNEWLGTAKKRNNVTAPFSADPESIEILEFEQKLINAASGLKKAGAEILHQKDEQLFTSTGGIESLPPDIPLIRVDTHEKAYIAADPNSGNRIYYPKHGYYGGIKVQEGEPSNQLTLFEMRAYGGFLAYLFNGYIDEAVRHLIRERDRFRNKQVSKKELVFFIKSSKTYEAYANGERIKFRLASEEKTQYDVGMRMRHVLEYNKKGEPEKIYITPIEKIKLDSAKYSERIEGRICKLLQPIQLMIAKEKHMMPIVLEESYPETKDRSFEGWHREELKQAPFSIAKKLVEQGRVLSDSALDIFASYRIYRSGFRPDFEHEEMQCAKAHWAMNQMNSNASPEERAYKAQKIIPSSRGGFHIVTISGHPGEHRYKCTCEHNRIKRTECRHIKQAIA